MKRMVLKTPAKINLALDVVGKRADGYHTLETVFQTVSLYDTITVTLFPHRTGEQAIRILCNIPWIPKDERNIAWKAVDLFLKKTGCPVGFDIYLQKYIPSQAGLGGGSSDAAITVMSREDGSGTRGAFIELFGIEEEENGEVFIYRFKLSEDGEPDLENIEDDAEYEMAADAFDEALDKMEFDEIVEEDEEE